MSVKTNNIVFKTLNNEYKSKKVSISMQLGAKTKVADNLLDGQILLSAVFNGKDQKDHSNIFRLEIELIGYFQAESEQDENSFQKFLNLNGIATLMPFLRSSVADITRTANYGTILLPLINVHNLKNWINRPTIIKQFLIKQLIINMSFLCSAHHIMSATLLSPKKINQQNIRW